jgi:class 3 adenylate cyclase
VPSFDCPRCGAGLRRGRKFCNSCGLALAGCQACGGLNARDARFCGDCGVALQQAPAEALTAVEDAGGDAAPERRQLTVMFCDLVGSTALSDRLDPEELQTVIAAFHGCAAELVARFDGAVAQYLGDGMLVYFGYPHAHEDDAERSVRAALAIIAAVHALRPVPGVALQTRIGIATGLVVIGELVGNGPQRRHAVIGKTPHLAARLQGIAEPDSVVIGAATRQLIHALFECADLGQHQLKGIATPAPAWRVIGERRTRSRFKALHEGALTRFIGRERELAVIRRRWAEAKAGHGQVVLLSGEPGMGKSRLVQALLESLRGEPCYRFSYHGSPRSSNSITPWKAVFW